MQNIPLLWVLYFYTNYARESISIRKIQQSCYSNTNKNKALIDEEK